MRAYVLGFEAIDRHAGDQVGGKGASLGELARLEGVRVPAGFCVTTEAYARSVEGVPGLGALIDRLAGLAADDIDGARDAGAAIRAAIEGAALPAEVEAAIADAHARLGTEAAYAVRSSATAEDAPTASFAGQHDTYLDVVGLPAVLAHVRRCWASLFTERAVSYRRRQGLDHRQARMAVVVQTLVRPRAAGVLFTADPITGNRKVTAIEAVAGLGEALVAGHVNAERYQACDGHVTARPAGAPLLADAEVLRLEALGRRLEAHFGGPQDVEWCLADDAIHVVQSRPITTLFPIPETGEGGNRVFVSTGHQQMMTDPFKPLGLAFWQLLAGRPMFEAGGRPYVDITAELASPAGRHVMLNVLGGNDPLIRDALTTVLGREGFLEPVPDAPAAAPPLSRFEAPPEVEPAIVGELIARSQAELAELSREIATKAGPALVDFIVDDIQKQKARRADPQSFGAVMAGMNAATWLNAKLLEWLGEKQAADVLAQSVPHNVTSEMGLALLDVADAIRPYPEVISYLRTAEDAGFLEGLAPLAGGKEARAALEAYLGTYGMRGAGEIDLTRPRWAERPTTLVPTILGNVQAFAPGEAARRFAHGQKAAEAKAADLLARLAALPDGEAKAAETARMIDRLRAFAGYREHPKYVIVSQLAIYKRALLAEADRLGLDREAICYLTIPELREAFATGSLASFPIARRAAEHERNWKLTPPRVLTSEGEGLAGRYDRADLPAGAIVGLPVSAGVVEGRARVLLDMADADLAPGDILVTRFTDPSWTPLFLGIKGLVTEVGGLMTHGAVIAREYGLPAVVGVDGATERIEDGQRIRVHGTDGYIEILA